MLERTENIKKLEQKIIAAGGTPYYVGGAVRDVVVSINNGIIELPPKDLDMEVFGLDISTLRSLLPEDKNNMVGKSFGVFKIRIDGVDMDISIPRREKKVGEMRQDFEPEFDPMMSTEEAARRRDYTINAMMWNISEECLIDHYGGQRDLDYGILRHVFEETFIEDELRVLRGMQFCSRFDLKPHPITITLCRKLSYPRFFDKLPIERIWEEWLKWALKSTRPSSGINFLKEVNWLFNFPLLCKLDGCVQDPYWHPEGDALVHSSLAADVMRRLLNQNGTYDEDTQISLMFAALLHDIGKPNTTEIREDGRITSYNHAPYGAPIAVKFMESIGFHDKHVERVRPLVKEHMCHIDWRVNSPSSKALRKASVRLAPATISELFLIFEADVSSRPPLEPEPQMIDVLERAKELGVAKGTTETIIFGRHIVELFPEKEKGPWIGKLVKEAYIAQNNEEFHDLEGGKQWLLKQKTEN